MNKFKQIILTLLLCAAGMTAWAYDFEKDGIYYNITSYSAPYTVEVTCKDINCNSYSGNVVIPESVAYDSKTYSVTTIGNYAFFGCTGLASITIPNPVTTIGNYAFYGCTGLASITIPNSVTTIGFSAFSGCTGLTSVTIPDSVIYIGGEAFDGCTGLTSVTIGNSVTMIEAYTFYGCTGLTSVTIPNSVTYIGDEAFYGCTGLTSITIPNSVTDIGGSAFYGCTSLTSVTIPNSVTSVYGDVYHNTGWYNNQPDGILYLDGWCLGYKGEKPVGILSIEEGTIGIAHTAFYDCTDITSVTIGNSVISIGNEAFYGCTGLTSITIPNSVTTVGSHVFHNTGWYNNQPDGILYLDGWCLGYKGEEPEGILSIEEGTIGIAGQAFLFCANISSVVIPNSVTTIGDAAFYGCTGLTSITIPNSVTLIGDSAFKGCTGLTSITIPNSVTDIGWSAFYGCTGLTSVNIGNSVTSIWAGAFYGCTSLTSVTIGNSVTSIGSYAFEGCSNLDTIIALGTTPPTLGTDAFFGISSEAMLFVPCGTTTSYSQQFNMFDSSNIYEECNSYPVTVNPTGSTGGEISVSTSSAQLGEDVEVYVTLEDGYVVESIVAYNANNPSQIVPISPAGAKDVLTYSFVMMPFPVKVEATFRSTEGIGEGNNIATTLYPNPTNGKVTIEAENLQRISVFNTMGQKVLESTVEGNSFECDMSHYGAGVYMMQIETGNGIATKRVVVER